VPSSARRRAEVGRIDRRDGEVSPTRAPRRFRIADGRSHHWAFGAVHGMCGLLECRSALVVGLERADRLARLADDHPDELRVIWIVEMRGACSARVGGAEIALGHLARIAMRASFAERGCCMIRGDAVIVMPLQGGAASCVAGRPLKSCRPVVLRTWMCFSRSGFVLVAFLTRPSRCRRPGAVPSRRRHLARGSSRRPSPLDDEHVDSRASRTRCGSLTGRVRRRSPARVSAVRERTVADLLFNLLFFGRALGEPCGVSPTEWAGSGSGLHVKRRSRRGKEVSSRR